VRKKRGEPFTSDSSGNEKAGAKKNKSITRREALRIMALIAMSATVLTVVVEEGPAIVNSFKSFFEPRSKVAQITMDPNGSVAVPTSTNTTPVTFVGKALDQSGGAIAGVKIYPFVNGSLVPGSFATTAADGSYALAVDFNTASPNSVYNFNVADNESNA